MSEEKLYQLLVVSVFSMLNIIFCVANFLATRDVMHKLIDTKWDVECLLLEIKKLLESKVEEPK